MTISNQQWSSEALKAANTELKPLTAQERVRWAYERFGNHLVLSTSFGIQSAVLLHCATQVYAQIPVIFIDTGYLFPETYRFGQQLTERLQLNLKKYQPLLSAAEQEALYGKQWERGLEEIERYNHTRKVEPMNRALEELEASAWLAGLRQVQAESRQDLNIIQQQKRMIKIYPIVDWTDRDVYRYLKMHDLPYHPLWEEGYVSVGDVHSTSRLLEGMRPEDTRFQGLKRECGLHEVSDNPDYQI